MSGHILLVIAIMLAQQWTLGLGEVFTAQVDLEETFPAHESIVEHIEVFLAKEELRLKEIRRRLQPFIERGKQDPQTVIQNPISAYLLLKGLTIDLDDVLAIAQQAYHTEELKQKIQLLKQSSKFPVTEDLNGAASALTRLQDTYQLEAADIARGALSGHCCVNKLNAEDLFELGRQCYNQGDLDHTILWMNEALLKFSEEKLNSTTFMKEYRSATESDILEYLAFSTYQKGELQGAIRLTEELLRIHPQHPRATGNIVHYRRMMAEKKGEDGEYTDKELDAAATDDHDKSQGVMLAKLSNTYTVREKREAAGSEKWKYEALCRGEMQNVQHHAKCHYRHGNKPYLLIGPLKEELVYSEPKIWIYHDIISDAEIEVVKRLARPKFQRATVHDHKTGNLVTAHYRISKSSWLKGSDHLVINTINERISALTGLDVETAEELQVVNYGLGGHYEPHFDFARSDERDAFQSLGTGNRIATFLIYMSDVEAGGATVFPMLDLTLYPVKGAAAFWYNLFEDGVGDYSTRHAACPVLLGTKWVANKWIHERGQEFRRPCLLSQSLQHDKGIRDY